MRFLFRLLLGLVALLLLLALTAFLLPSSYRVERSATIAARPEAVFAQVVDLKAWPRWSAWHERDPGMKISYSANSAGVGAWSAWESKTEGNGKMTYTAVEPNRRIAYTLVFPDMGMDSRGEVRFEPAGQGVRVIWTSEGDLGLNPMARWFGLLLDRLIGPDFEKGLGKLKALSEAKAS